MISPRGAEGGAGTTEPDSLLSRAAQEWRNTFDAIESPIVLLDTAGRVVRLNRAAQRLAGRSFEELIGRPLDQLVSGEPWGEVQRRFEEVRSGGARASGQVRDARDRSWEVLANPVDAGPGGAARAIIMARDVSAVVRLEASLQRAEAMAAMGALVAGVAHEVRNPLFAISALVDAMEARGGAGAALQQYLVTLRAEIDRLSWLMRDLLEYGSPRPPERAPADVGELIGRAVELCRRAATRAAVSLSGAVSDRPTPMHADGARVVQALVNLIENAIQHSPPGAPVRVVDSTPAEDRDRWVDIAVVDGGPGFREGDLTRVFEPFFTRRRGGTGLGLCIAQRIAEAHGGGLTAKNGGDGGAIVTMRLPLTGPAGSGTGAAARGA